MTDYEDTKKTINEIAKEFNGRLDIFVANAGVPWQQGRMIDGELSHYHKVVSTDLDSVFYCAKAAGEIFRKQYETGVSMTGESMQNYSYGSFIATASMSGHIANIPQLQSAYNAAKAGVIHLCRSLAVEWVKFARANTGTEQQPHCSALQADLCGFSITRLYGDRDLKVRAPGDEENMAIKNPYG